MKISVIHASRSRPQQCYDVVKKWIQRADIPRNHELEYIVSIDFDDDIEKYYPIEKEYWAQLVVQENKSAIEAINWGAKHATGDVLISVSDDTDCPDKWMSKLIELICGKSDFCAKAEDGIQPTLVTMPIVDRLFYERYGYIYNSDYKHLFCDQELTAVAMMTGKYIKLPLTFPHLHYSIGGMKKDAINIKNDATWVQGETLFNERLKSNFGIENPVMEYKEIKWR